jgi:hypothetical protein
MIYIALKEATWLSLIVVVPKKNGKFRIYVDFIKLNVATKKNPYIPFIFHIWSFKYSCKAWCLFLLNGYYGYHQISIAPEDIYNTTFVTNWGVFTCIVMPFGVKNGFLICQRVVSKTFRDYLDKFMNIFLHNFIIYNDMDIHLQKLKSCFQKCKEFGISLNPYKCTFRVFLGMILGFIISKCKLLDPKKI